MKAPKVSKDYETGGWLLNGIPAEEEDIAEAEERYLTYCDQKYDEMRDRQAMGED